MDEKTIESSDLNKSDALDVEETIDEASDMIGHSQHESKQKAQRKLVKRMRYGVLLAIAIALLGMASASLFPIFRSVEHAGASVMVHANATTGSGIVATLDEGDAFRVIWPKFSGDWYLIRLHNGKWGWVQAKNILNLSTE